MIIKQATFICSNTDYNKCPKTDLPEYAFIGRSNVGKSSLINMITNHKKLAKISGRPGKTQLINHFFINQNWYIVDLPGYGWARISKSERTKWKKMINDYFLNRENLKFVFVLVDSRHEPQKIDIEFVNWLGMNGLPLGIIFTKTDKLSPNKVQANVAKFKKVMLKEWEKMPTYFLSSSVSKDGEKEILSFIDEVNNDVKQQ